MTEEKETIPHRRIYAEANGPIPDGMVIHHKDGNHYNNDLDNLEAKTPKKHVRGHLCPELEHVNEELSRYIGFRIKAYLADWMNEYSEESGQSLSQIVRQALLELRARVESMRDAKNADDLEVLKTHIGEMFRFRQTEDGLLLERIEPQTILLGSGERRKRDATKSSAVAKGA
jgi:hypothetical protein